jgi:hypothetical protein
MVKLRAQGLRFLPPGPPRTAWLRLTHMALKNDPAADLTAESTLVIIDRARAQTATQSNHPEEMRRVILYLPRFAALFMFHQAYLPVSGQTQTVR